MAAPLAAPHDETCFQSMHRQQCNHMAATVMALSQHHDTSYHDTLLLTLVSSEGSLALQMPQYSSQVYLTGQPPLIYHAPAAANLSENSTAQQNDKPGTAAWPTCKL